MVLEERRLWLLGGYRASAVFAVFLQFYFLCRVDFALSCLLSTADSIAILFSGYFVVFHREFLIICWTSLPSCILVVTDA